VLYAIIVFYCNLNHFLDYKYIVLAFRGALYFISDVGLENGCSEYLAENGLCSVYYWPYRDPGSGSCIVRALYVHHIPVCMILLAFLR
jgi:hypothetical protein